MTVPPFPSQDLAKLVLGYLAEEQLMTAYDEFLQASPYLDPMRNEYDRIFMTSLKSIVAEYRAVKIFVETCKPLSLRRRLYGCSNLLEVVKFLVQHVDVSKFPSSETSTQKTCEKKLPVCETCLLRLPNCICHSRYSAQSSSVPSPSTETQVLDTSVETTSISDLPGTHVTIRRKQVRVLERESKVSQSTYNSSSGEQVEDLGSRNQLECSVADPATNNSRSSQKTDNALCYNAPIRSAETIESTQKLNELNTLDNCGYNSSSSKLASSDVQLERNLNRVSYASSFQDFAVGVSENDNASPNVPDSSTSENFSGMSSVTKDTNSSSNTVPKELTKAHILFKVGTVQDTSKSHFTYPGKIKPKPTEQKITILSDIKVDKQPSSDPATPMPEVLRNATSTPLMRMQTILINGTPAFRKVHDECEPIQNFTKDEIMAMPTIIIVPNSSSVPTSAHSQAQATVPPTSMIMSSVTPLRPLVIDVDIPSLPQTEGIEKKLPEPTSNNEEENVMLVKTVQGKNMSLPKDNVISTDSTNKQTPQVLPPVRKSSSTPRRTSHVRVLDFATPRRILGEAIDEQGENIDFQSGTEVIVSRSPNLHNIIEVTSSEEDPATQNVQKSQDHTGNNVSTQDNNVNKAVTNKKPNWDADLRALAVANRDGFVKTIPICQQRKKKHGVKKDKSKSNENKKISKSKKPKPDEVIDEPVILPDIITVPVKPTINIVMGPDWSTQENNKIQNEQNKSNEDPADTPEMDRSSLQNVIGAKLNISDLLETPYKQALYDIQMETPRFLGPDLPGDPLSDIKIMNIPTPRFLNTPKPAQATPSSYSSRPTDYSSGGSYYKPDDQDYLPLEDLGYPNRASEHTKQLEEETESNEDTGGVKIRRGNSRPVRTCTKNVSYYSPAVNKPKETCKDATNEDKVHDASMSSDSSFEIEKQKESKAAKPISSRRLSKETRSDTRVKKRKVPVKKETSKSFMKIKPRRPTPSKDTLRKTKRKTSDSQPKKKTSSKEKLENASPALICVPTKSRRKSSTPRKLHCTKILNSGNYPNNSPEPPKPKSTVQNSDVKHDGPTRWLDDSSEDVDAKERQDNSSTMNESEDINKIKEFIATSETVLSRGPERNLHTDLVKRGFDEKTAKIIERDLLDTSPVYGEMIDVVNIDMERVSNEPKKSEAPLERTLESSAVSTNLQIVQEDEDDELELSVHECNEDAPNYITCSHEETKNMPRAPPVLLKDKYCMEVCIDDDLAIKLRATPFTLMLDEDPVQVERIDYSYRETEVAVSSISNFEKLYTPLKDSLKAQCYEIFDSTLTSLDTPLKATSPKIIGHETSVTEIVLEVEKVEVKEKDAKKRKRRISSEEENANEHKKTKPEPQYLLNPANIQNIDIESVLCKLHGP